MPENVMVENLRWLLAGGTLSVSGTSLTIDFETREEAEMAMDALEQPETALIVAKVLRRAKGKDVGQ